MLTHIKITTAKPSEKLYKLHDTGIIEKKIRTSEPCRKVVDILAKRLDKASLGLAVIAG